ncbi:MULTISPECIES: glycosyltransferase family 2 protein [unclassified Variovorax]|uniref:glycosyltransferase family 2 protein n=1 Tax=unclassified Variovorax TaxID=663243 RepID=UPI003F51862A
MQSKPTLPAAASPCAQPKSDPRGHDVGLHRRISALESQHKTLLAQASALRQSISWRITAPLRWLLEHARRAKRAMHALRGVRPRSSYQEWVAAYDAPDRSTRMALRSAIADWPLRPRLSVIVPSYNGRPAWLRQAIESVRSQIYPDWELCIADDASTRDEVRSLLRSYARSDPRIKVEFRPRNGHISVASNSALALASGEWIVLLDHDDLLAPHALYCVAREIVEHPEARMIYSDEDTIDARGWRSHPYFKPDWNPDLFRSQNMFSHLGAYQKRLVEGVGGFREGFEGSQDYDLALRCMERLNSAQIRHIPRVLYHWRAHDQSTAQSADAKPYAQAAAERALNEHFGRAGVSAVAEAVPQGYCVRYGLPELPPLVTLIIPTRNAEALVRQCVESIVARTAYPNYEILLVDNGSDDPEALAYFASLDAQPGFAVLRDDRPFNYSALNNFAVSRAQGEFVALVNNDIEVISPEWLAEMVSIAMQPGVGAVGAKLLYPDRTLQHAGVLLGVGGIAGHAHKHFEAWQPGYGGRAQLIQSFSAVTAACMVVRKSLYEQVGGLDEQHLPVAYNDVDFCLRLREAGYRNVWTPYAELLHHESATRGADITAEARERFEMESAYMRQRWGELLAADPAYNPNLTLDHEGFGLAWPPRVAPLDAPLRIHSPQPQP